MRAQCRTISGFRRSRLAPRDDGIHGRLDDGECRARAEAELDPPGYQVEAILAADLAPQREDRDHRYEELRRICEAKYAA